MTPAKQEQLFTKYPSLFSEMHKDVSTDLSERPWPISFGIACGNGWFKLIDELCFLIVQSLEQYNERHKTAVGIRIVQIKEKFGGLRYYYTWSAKLDLERPHMESLKSRIEGACQVVENLSLSTCELCGSPAACTTESWYHTTCAACTSINDHYIEAP
jgi:hypothetical protein